MGLRLSDGAGRAERWKAMERGPGSMTVTSDRRRDRGSATVLVIGVLGVLVLVGGAAVMVGTAVVATHRAATAADLAALAGAVALRDAGSTTAACSAARRQTTHNGGILLRCSVGVDASVTVHCAVATRLVGPGLPTSVERAARAGPSPFP